MNGISILFALPMLASASEPTPALPDDLVTMGKVGFAIWIISMLVGIWRDVRPKKSLEDKIARQLAEMQAANEQRAARCILERDGKVVTTEVRLNKDITRIEELIVKTQEERKESAHELYSKIDTLRKDVSDQTAQIVSATNNVIRDYSMLIGEMKGELKVRREMAMQNGEHGA